MIHESLALHIKSRAPYGCNLALYIYASFPASISLVTWRLITQLLYLARVTAWFSVPFNYSVCIVSMNGKGLMKQVTLVDTSFSLWISSSLYVVQHNCSKQNINTGRLLFLSTTFAFYPKLHSFLKSLLSNVNILPYALKTASLFHDGVSALDQFSADAD